MRLALVVLLFVAAVRAEEPLQILDTVETSMQLAAADPAAQSLHYLLERLPTPYELIKINRSRARQWAKTNDNACMPWLRRTPDREKDFLFSAPYLLESSLQLIVRRDSPLDRQLSQQVDSQGRLSLRLLMAQQDFPIIGVEQARSYGPVLDVLIVELAAQQRIFQRNAPPEQVGFSLQMLEKNFVDATLEYPKVVKLSGLPLRGWPLQEAEPYTLVHFACSKTAAGAATIKMLNQLIHSAALQPAYQQMAVSSLTSETRAEALLHWQHSLAATKD